MSTPQKRESYNKWMTERFTVEDLGLKDGGVGDQRREAYDDYPPVLLFLLWCAAFDAGQQSVKGDN